MSTTTTVLTVTAENSKAIAEQINEAVGIGRIATLNGQAPVYSMKGTARSHGNGTVSYMTVNPNGRTVHVYVKVGQELAVETIDAIQPEPLEDEAEPVEVPRPRARERRSVDDGRQPVPATVKGETGYLALRVVDGSFRYAVTMDEKTAARFTPGASMERHIRRARDAGIQIAAA